MTFFDKIKNALGLLPPKLFYEGQEITPNHDHRQWVTTEERHPSKGPKNGEIVKCVEYIEVFKNTWYIKISGYLGRFKENDFSPVISDDQLEEMLNGIDELIIKKEFSN